MSRRSASASGVSTKISMKSPSATRLADHRPLGAERADEGGEHDQARIHHQLRRLAGAADILDPVGGGEAEILVEAEADIVAVEQEGVAPARVQLGLDQIGDGRFAGAGQAGEPEQFRPLLLEPGAQGAGVTSSACSWTFSERRSAKWISPAATVAALIRSIRMKPPSARLAS